MRVLIIGCGYVGLELGKNLVKEGHEVYGLRRSVDADDLKQAGIIPLQGDITQPQSLAGLPSSFDWVVNTVSSSRGGAEEYENIYVNGSRLLLEWLSQAPPKKLVYTSSTSVYGQTDGSVVKESSLTSPSTETGKFLVEAEKIYLGQKTIPSVVLRVAGIYGPGRGHLFHQFLRNEARIHGKGDRVLNMIHLHDLARVIQAALKNGRAGEIYNAVDDEPVSELHYFQWLGETLGKWLPPRATEEELANRKRGFTNKKVSNRKLKMELGFQFKYPTFRQGYTAEIQRLDALGELHIVPESR